MHFRNLTTDPINFSMIVASGDEPSGVLRSPLLAMVVLLAVLWAATCPAVAQTLTVLHSFDGNDGAYPFSRLTIDRQGNLYGTTGGTVPPTFGTIFELSRSNPVGNLLVLLRRTPTGICDFCVDNLLRDSEGNLYVSDAIGGNFGNGAVYKLSPAGLMPTVLYSFTGGADGKYPNDGLISDAEGNLYGTTGMGGAFGQGVVFKVTPAGVETVLYSFTGGADGGEPWGRLLRDSQGNFYGTTYLGGGLQLSFGVVFELSASGVETVLHSFTGGSDGGHPNGDLIADAQGNLYGTTPAIPRSTHGTVFKVSPQGVLNVLHSFLGPDGFSLRSGVIMDSGGNFYGTTFSGGVSNDGVVYELNANGTETVLHSFSGSDGALPVGGLVFDTTGNLYGTTAYGGTSNNGVVFKLTP
jgi:uncharacterized repeat protein (TIGR03803 family)